ncbi:Zinc finger, RING/FYVE/PHD-type [Plasmopara halstedii]|uniref:Zinc finger, RING/FYVE/PHD-type n=1 Tax=Plasmopara halstedii TaxID=4781 RepID=A0A0P1AB12_PLAHL|nr:Zinc finger, RING/FYVE/PHD-type [Plasmopara halstedii]CEG37368.1 Zinc finger, RING/FYVE/PHD-type [Plasmopara halstedii]|eukprot:XP_024573737.1 Zinc finger, RING/FYVE/PHD-type [Plasmopara halstedii]
MGSTNLSEQDIQLPGSKQDQLILSAEEGQRLANLADLVVDDTLAYYNRFRFIEKRVVDSTAWKDVGHRDNLIVYRERSGPRPAYPSIRVVDNKIQLIPCRSAPSVKIVGMLQGTLDDEMYGCFIDSDDSAKMRKEVIGDMMDNFHWLATIAEPNQKDLFRFCGIARCTFGTSLPLTKTRGVCMVVSMGITTTNRGERMGYYVAHSVDLSEPDVNYSYIQAKCSLCWLKTELPNGKIELYMKGFATPMGFVPEFAAFPVLVNCVLGIGMTSDAAYSKKLAWMIHDNSKAGQRSSLPPMNVCVGRCKNKFSGLRTSATLRRCLVCQKAVCNTCQVVRKIPVSVTDGRVNINKGSVCILCIHQAKTMSAMIFVRRELLCKRWKNIDTARVSITKNTECELVLKDKAFYLTD